MRKIDIKTKEGKRLVIALSMMGILLLSFGTYLLLKSNTKDWKPITKKIEIEYGDPIKIDKDTFIKEEDETFVEVIEIDFEVDTKMKDDKEYYILGEHKGNLKVEVSDQEQEFEFEVIVKDTITPLAKEFNEEIIIEKGYEGNFNEFFIFEDVDEDIVIEIDVKDFDKNTEGIYQGDVKAEDSSKNKTEKTFEVHVKDNVLESEKTKAISSDGTSNSAHENSSQKAPDKTVNVDEDNSSNSSSNNDNSSAAEQTKPKPDSVKTHKDVTTNEVIPYTSKRVADASMYEGKERVTQQGSNGNRRIVTRIYYTDGVETSREQISNTVTASARDHIVAYGTAKRPTNVVGAFGESPAGLLSYTTYTMEGFPFGKEYYQTRDQAIARGENLIDRDMIFNYSHGSDSQGFYVTFRLDY